MSSLTQKGGLFSALRALCDEINTEKQAAVKNGSPVPSDPGGYQGPTTHPSKDVDNRGQDASEGARSAENTADVKADQGPPAVDRAPDNKDGRQDDVQYNIGTQQSATGEHPEVEDDYKGGKDDPGTSHPADTENDSLDGHKYAGASLPEIKQASDHLANKILADLANGFGSQLAKTSSSGASTDLRPSAAGENPPPQPRVQSGGSAETNEKTAGTSLNTMIKQAVQAVRDGKQPDSPAADNPELQAGYDLAAYLGVEKRAAQEAVAGCLEDTINDAHLDADLFGSFYLHHKQAMHGGDPAEGEDHSLPGDDTSGASGAEGLIGTGPEGASEGDLGGLGDLLGGGADPGGLAEAPAMGDDMGGIGEEEALMQLVAALEELGIPIEELAAAGPPPGEGEMLGEGMKLASAAKAFRRSGRYRFKSADEGSRERALRDRMKGHLIELLSAK